MAAINRISNDLLTLKLSLVPGRSESVVHCDLYRGRDVLTQMRWPADAFAIPRSLTIEKVSERATELFDPALIAAGGGLGDLGESLTAALADRSAPDEPLWLQVANGSNYLATVPWEALIPLLAEAEGVPIFRIPNFVVDPQFPVTPPRLALCASSPQAKFSYEAGYYVRDAVAAFADVFDEAEVHVFVDGAAMDVDRAAMDDVASLSRDGNFRVVVHDPEEASSLGTGTRRLVDTSGAVSSPWLLWMQEQLGPRRTDLVHFITPGYFTADLGGLALAHSPLGDLDSRRAHFISASEINQFLNSVGAWAAGFTIPRPDPWSIGVRIFAEQLARQRSEPITLHEPDLVSNGPDRFAGLAEMYRAVCAPPGARPPIAPGTSSHVHPKRFVADDETDLELVSVAQQDYASSVGPMTGEPWHEILTKAAGSGRRMQPQAEPRWKASLQLEVEQTLSKLVADRIETPEQRGEAAALSFIQDALDRSNETELEL